MNGRQRFLTKVGLLISLTASFYLFSCGKNSGGLKRHDLFTISLGTLPDELDWFYREGYRMAGTADIQTRDGLVFISGGEAGKIMVFNSYGDLLTYVYDPLRNPAPAVNENGETSSTAVRWSFRKPSVIAAFDGGFMVDDGVEQERQVLDSETGAVYDRVVLRFSQEGEYLGHLGREGFGGSPFPYIVSIDIRENGDLVICSRVAGAWMSYWYNREGHPLTTVRILEDQLPGLEEGGNVSVYSIRPDPVKLMLHIRLDVYPSGSNEPDPRLYSLNLATLKYNNPIILELNGGNMADGFSPVPPEYLGTTADGNHMMIALEAPALYRMTLIDPQGRTIQNRQLEVDSTATIYHHFKMQNDGLLTGIFFGPEKAPVAWWRVDKLAGNDR